MLLLTTENIKTLLPLVQASSLPDKENLLTLFQVGLENEGEPYHSYRKAAFHFAHEEGHIEIDQHAVVSMRDTSEYENEEERELLEGAYVQAWIWISREEMLEKSEDEPEDPWK